LFCFIPQKGFLYLSGKLTLYQKLIFKDSAFLLNSFNITPKGIQDAILRVGGSLQVRTAEWNYMDETGMRVLGSEFKTFDF